MPVASVLGLRLAWTWHDVVTIGHHYSSQQKDKGVFFHVSPRSVSLYIFIYPWLAFRWELQIGYVAIFTYYLLGDVRQETFALATYWLVTEGVVSKYKESRWSQGLTSSLDDQRYEHLNATTGF